ncbi:DUF2232 domain-containing protein [Clostridium aminobutyricum]|uniref:DUF2232 domain-containing protein n=1 Tax=Clostridium aminobutyricum TaxID=33953 RepID=A0A939IGJ1_CLOAM|nr:DUF2232 domain-containing protein [Clostridium aminobutyricum]MBN7773380.1 DUF2232 domain-containing protein [Clostridium aminobutyricum]
MYTLIIFSAVLFLPVPIMVMAARKSGSGYRAILEGVIGVALAMVLFFVIAALNGMPVGQTIAENLQTISENMAANSEFVKLAGLEEQSFTERVSAISQIYTYAINALPAVILSWATIIAYFEYLIISKASLKKKEPLPQLSKFKNFSMPWKALWGWILIYALTWIVVSFGFEQGNVLQINIQILFELAFEIQGMAVIFYFIESKRQPKVIAALLCIVFMCTNLGKLLLSALGFLDLALGLRKVRIKRQ